MEYVINGLFFLVVCKKKDHCTVLTRNRLSWQPVDPSLLELVELRLQLVLVDVVVPVDGRGDGVADLLGHLLLLRDVVDHVVDLKRENGVSWASIMASVLGEVSN